MPTDAAPLDRAGIRRILIVKWSALGDVVIASALMQDIALAFPDAEIDLNTMPNCLGLFAHDPRFREVFALDVRKKGQRWQMAREWLKRVRAGRYDLLIDLQRSDHTRFLLTLLWLSGGAPRHRLGNRGGFPYTQQPQVRDPQAHAFRMMRSVLESAGIPVATTHPVFHASPESAVKVAALRAQHQLHDGRYVVLLPGSQAAGVLKRWGIERYAELAGLLHRQGMDKVVLIGGPDEVEDCRQIALTGDFIVNLNGALGLLEIAPLCAGAAAIIGNDTGTAHFSAGAGRPLLVICGPTDPRRVKPIGDQALALQAALPCSNCYAKTCANAEQPHACMQAITPTFIAAQFARLQAGALRPGGSEDTRLFFY
jgi:heptosyltransferase-2